MPKIKVAKLSIDPSIATSSSQLSINNGQLTINSDPNYTSTTPQTVADNSSSLDVSTTLASLEERFKGQESKFKSLEERLALLEASSSAQSTSGEPGLTPEVSSSSAVLSEATSSATISANLAEATSSATNSAFLGDTTSKVGLDSFEVNKLTPPDILFATGSAVVADLKVHSDATISGTLTAYKLNVSDGFKSFGATSLGNTTVAGNLSVDGTLSIENGSEINVIGTLYLQKSILAQKLDIFNGAVIVDKTGTIKAQTISAREYLGVSGTTVGSGKILAGTKQVDISSSLVKSNSRILVTPTTETALTLAVTSKVEGQKFSVSLATPTPADIEFDWFIVNESP